MTANRQYPGVSYVIFIYTENNMSDKKHLITVGILLFLISFLTIRPVSASAADSFDYRDYNRHEDMTYEGVIPSYVVNGITIDMSTTPALINDRGIAMAPANRLFRDVIGAECFYSPALNRITFAYEEHVLILYLNSTRAILDGTPMSASCESYRIRYDATGEYATFVPSRFVAESLGLSYKWDSYASTVTIKAPMEIIYGGVRMDYTGVRGGVSFNGQQIDVHDTPTLMVADYALVELQKTIAADPQAQFTYNPSTGDIRITRGDITMEMTVDQTAVYVNDVLTYAPKAPVIVTNLRYEKAGLYVPAKFVFETLGYTFDWRSTTGTVSLRTGSKTGVYKQDNDMIRLINANTPATPHYDKDGTLHELYQEIYIPLPAGVDPETAIVDDDVYDHRVRITLKGDYRTYYQSLDIANSGTAVRQIQIYYMPSGKKTVIDIYTVTDSERHILGHILTRTKKELQFIFDRPKELYDKIIVLDAGHGGTNYGVTVKKNYEKNINLKIVNEYCRELFEDSDIKVYFTRTDDTDIPLRSRAELGARLQADMFISIHQNNIAQTEYSGTTTYYGATNNQRARCGLTSSVMAKIFQTIMTNSLGFTDRGTKAHDYDVTLYNEIPAILIECGFMSNPEEYEKLISEDYQRLIAQAIFKGVKTVYGTYDFSVY